MSLDQPRQSEQSPIALWSERLGVIGGIISMVMAALVTVSVLGRWLFDQGVPGDFEFVQMGTAVSVFFFLVACQAKRGNIVVDTFTGFLSTRQRNRLDAVWDVVFAMMMALLAYCAVLGAYEAYANHALTMVLQFQTWPALAICAALLIFLVVVCLWTARRLWSAR